MFLASTLAADLISTTLAATTMAATAFAAPTLSTAALAAAISTATAATTVAAALAAAVAPPSPPRRRPPLLHRPLHRRPRHRPPCPRRRHPRRHHHHCPFPLHRLARVEAARAAVGRAEGIVKMLLDHGAQLDHWWKHAMSAYLQHGGTFTGQDDQAQSLLCTASLKGFVTIVELLLDRHADVDGGPCEPGVYPSSLTPLMHAA